MDLYLHILTIMLHYDVTCLLQTQTRFWNRIINCDNQVQVTIARVDYRQRNYRCLGNIILVKTSMA